MPEWFKGMKRWESSKRDEAAKVKELPPTVMNDRCAPKNCGCGAAQIMQIGGGK